MLANIVFGDGGDCKKWGNIHLNVCAFMNGGQEHVGSRPGSGGEGAG
jgi:hypothetical protein